MAVLSQTSEYALQAVTALAKRAAEGPTEVGVLAATLRVPKNYLSKILSQLSRAGVLTSIRGRNGGFSLARPAGDITLYQVVEPFERFEATRRCLLGQASCSERSACTAHAAWSAIGDSIIRFLRRTTLAELATRQPSRPQKARRPTRSARRLADSPP